MDLEDRALVLAGGRGERLYNLTKERAKPATPFAGLRIIDGILSRLVASGVRSIDVITDLYFKSLTDHLTRWDRAMGLDEGIRSTSMYNVAFPHFNRGSGDAMYIYWYGKQSEKEGFRNLVVVSADLITDIDFSQLIAYHEAQKSDLTLTVRKVPTEEASRFGVIEVDKDWNVIGFEEKPADPRPIPGEPGFALINENNNIWKNDALDHAFRNLMPGSEKARNDQSCDMVVPLIGGPFRIKAFEHEGYWADVGTLRQYYDTLMMLTSSLPALNIYSEAGKLMRTVIDTHLGQGVKVARPYGVISGGTIANNGTIISGTVDGSVLGYGVQVREKAEIRDSGIFNRGDIQEDALVRNSILDKDVYVGRGAVIDPARFSDHPSYRIAELPGGHLLVQAAWDRTEIEPLLNGRMFIPQLYMSEGRMGERRFMEAVLTPEDQGRIAVFSKYSHIPDGHAF